MLQGALPKLDQGMWSDVANALLHEIEGRTMSYFSSKDVTTFSTRQGIYYAKCGRYRRPYSTRRREFSPSEDKNTEIRPKAGKIAQLRTCQPLGRARQSRQDLEINIPSKRLISSPKDCNEDKSEGNLTMRSRWGDLPSWAKQKSRAAVLELMGHCKR